MDYDVDTVYRIMVGAVPPAEESDTFTAKLREDGYEVVPLGEQEQLDAFVTGAVQDDVDILNVTVDGGDHDRIHTYLSEKLDKYDGDDILLAVESDEPVYPEMEQWTNLDGIGAKNGRILAESGLDPDRTTYTELEDALIAGYQNAYEDDLTALQAGRSQATRIRRYNKTLFDT